MLLGESKHFVLATSMTLKIKINETIASIEQLEYR
jgi:hypothetical protein